MDNQQQPDGATSMASEESDSTAAPLALRLRDGAGSMEVAEALIAAWEAIDNVLVPIVGSRGIAALYRRSLHLAAAQHPWLASARQEGHRAAGLAALRSAVERQDAAQAALGARTLLQTFDQLLSSLIGPALTERLLRRAGSEAPRSLPDEDSTA